MDTPRATVREIDGQLVLDDPDALGMIRAVAKHNCRNTLEANRERVGHFKNRASERGLSWSDVVVVVINVDDVHGRPFADALMPGMDWQAIRDRGEVPFARGLAGRPGVLQCLELFDQEAAEALRGGLNVVVVDQGVAACF